MTIKKDENVLAGKKTPNVLPIETTVTVTNAQTGINTLVKMKHKRT